MKNNQLANCAKTIAAVASIAAVLGLSSSGAMATPKSSPSKNVAQSHVSKKMKKKARTNTGVSAKKVQVRSQAEG